MMENDEIILKQIMSDEYKKKYTEYFFPEIKPFLTEEIIEKYNSKNLNLKNEKNYHIQSML